MSDISEIRNGPVKPIIPLESSFNFLFGAAKQNSVRLPIAKWYSAEHKTPQKQLQGREFWDRWHVTLCNSAFPETFDKPITPLKSKFICLTHDVKFGLLKWTVWIHQTQTQRYPLTDCLLLFKHHSVFLPTRWGLISTSFKQPFIFECISANRVSFEPLILILWQFLVRVLNPFNKPGSRKSAVFHEAKQIF